MAETPSGEHHSGRQLVILALGMWAGSALIAAGTTYLWSRAATPAAAAVLSIIYAVSGLMALGGTLSFIMGAIRWALLDMHDLQAMRQASVQMTQLMRTMNDRMLISDTAKRLAYREQDRQAVRQLIESDIEKGEFDAAMVLVKELADTYGCKEEAEVYRERITQARSEQLGRRVDDAIAGLSAILAQHAWDKAMLEAEKIQRLYPDSPRVRTLAREVREAREQHKKDLEREFLRAAERDDVDRAMELLKELDHYLTEKEAIPFQETARGVIGKKRQNLGVQYKLAVADADFIRALQTAEQIIREFPNTKMADEVRAHLPVLRERAAGQRTLESGPANVEQSPA
jgi:hypothetical protein